MATRLHRINTHLTRMLRERSLGERGWQLEPKHDDPAPTVPCGIRLTQESIERRWAVLQNGKRRREALLDLSIVTRPRRAQNLLNLTQPCSAGKRSQDTCCWNLR